MEKNLDKTIQFELAKRLKALRKQKGLTQAECYIDTGINFGRIERGIRNISFTTLNKICTYFNISMSEFLIGFEDIFKDKN